MIIRDLSVMNLPVSLSLSLFYLFCCVCVSYYYVLFYLLCVVLFYFVPCMDVFAVQVWGNTQQHEATRDITHVCLSLLVVSSC